MYIVSRGRPEEAVEDLVWLRDWTTKEVKSNVDLDMAAA